MDLLPIKDVAEAVQVDPSTIRRHCRLGNLDGATQIGRDWLVPAKYADPGTYHLATKRRRPPPETEENTR